MVKESTSIVLHCGRSVGCLAPWLEQLDLASTRLDFSTSSLHILCPPPRPSRSSKPAHNSSQEAPPQNAAEVVASISMASFFRCKFLSTVQCNLHRARSLSGFFSIPPHQSEKKFEISAEIESPFGFPLSMSPLPLRFCGGKKEGLLPSSLGPPLGPRHIIGAAPSAMPGCCSPPTPAAGCLHRLGRSIVCIYVDGVNSGYNVSFPDFLESQITHFSSFRSYIYASSFPLKGALHYCNTSISTLAGPHLPHLVLRSQYATQCLIDEASTKAAPSSSSWSDLVLTWRMLVREGGREGVSVHHGQSVQGPNKLGCISISFPLFLRPFPSLIPSILRRRR